MKTPAVIVKTQFVSPKGNNSFNKYVNYIDRKNTHSNENNFEDYQKYMSNEEKSTGLFTNEKDNLSEEEKLVSKEIIQAAQDKNSLLWQDVISFNNSWLKEVGVLKNTADGQFIDEKKLKQVTRNSVNTMWKNEGLEDSIYWAGAIHYNTDNIHVHVASVQTRDIRERGKRKQKSIDKLKSSVIHGLVDRSKENEKLNDFIRNKVVGSKKEHSIMSVKNRVFDREFVHQFKNIHSQLPEDKRTWMYSMSAMKELQPELNKLTDMYIQKKFPNEFKEFKSNLDKEVKFYEQTYGDNSRAEKFRETKMNDLYKRTGNVILKEMKEYDKKLNSVELVKNQNSKKNNFKRNRAMHQLVYAVNREMKDELQHYKNQNEFEKLQYESELNRD